ncbi:MAG: T9SS type A sorting domain-containing protein [Ignavibacteriales bacterium]|nr:MAG: T9SS type A sorting domain-containing protein [Ignavibacteriales bacterium]
MKTNRVPFLFAAFIAVVLFAGSVFAQAPTLPLDFESGTVNYTFTNFDGGVATVINNPQIGGINTSAKVAQMVKGAGQPWAGAYLTLAAPIDFSTNKFFKVKVFMPRTGAKLLLKVENETNPAINFERELTGTVANGWEELTFDYTAINAANQYSKVVFIFDLGTVGNGSPDFTYLFDDIRLTTGTPPPPDTTQMNLPVTFDVPWINYGLVGFEGAENSTIVDDPTMAGNKVAKAVKSATAQPWAGTTVTAVTGGVQTGFKTKVPFTEQEKRMNVRVWSPHAGIQVRLKVEDHLNNTITCETEATVTIANQWQTLVFDFGNPASGTAPLNLANNYNKASIFFNFGVNGATAGERTYYFDDMAFGLPVIPVELTSFTASVSGNVVNLNWATATETNNKGFEVQRKSTAGEFKTVAFVNGNGTTVETRSYSYSDIISEGTYSYRLKQVDFDGSYAYSQTVEVSAAPSEFSLEQNYPNPFNPSTMISFSLPFESKVSLMVYNTLGEVVSELVNGTFSAGYNQVSFNASSLTSGIYFYSITASAVDGSQTFQSMKKMILTK